jgi:hypothetical protein
MASQNTIASDFNLQKINTKEYEDNLKATIDYGGNIFVAAKRGTGKTVIAKQMINKCKHKEIYINISVCDRPDLAGYPDFFGAKSGDRFVKYLLPAYFKDLIEGDEPCVVLLDEVDKSDSSLNAPLLEFTQFHSINGMKFKNMRSVIMTGNLIAEGGARPTLPLLDRTEKYLLEASHEHWMNWAGIAGVHPSITAYLADNPGDLFGDVDPGDAYADSSPRGWESSSKIVQFGEQKNWPSPLMATKVSGYVGKKIGIKYRAYFDHYQVLLPIVAKIMEGEEVKEFQKLEPGKQMVATMIACARVARIIDDQKVHLSELKNKPAPISNVGKFMKRVDPEMALVSVRSQIGVDRFIGKGLDSDPIWDSILDSIRAKMNG